MSRSDDLADIAAVIHRYSRAMDCREWQLMDEVFVAEATATFNDTTRLRGRAQIVGLIRAAIECCRITHHMNTNIEITIDGDTARVRNLFRAWHRGSGARSDVTFEALGSYEDEFVRTATGWRILHRAERSPIEFGDGAALFGEAIAAFLASL
jgi:ketosteroid isomerase-like protein